MGIRWIFVAVVVLGLASVFAELTFPSKNLMVGLAAIVSGITAVLIGVACLVDAYLRR